MREELEARAKALASGALAICMVAPALAQTLPDAGTTLRDAAPVLPAQPRQQQPIKIDPPSPQAARPEGGAAVVLRGVAWRGNTVLSDAELLAELGPDVLGKSYDLAGLRQLAERATAAYRARGLPFAQVFVLPQQIRDGIVAFQVVEGRWGRLEFAGDERLANGARGYLGRVQPGDLIATPPLEQSLLVLGDLPGIQVTPHVRPGQKLGEGDLVVQVEQTAKAFGEIGVDNAGSRYTGDYRMRGSISAPSLLAFGDRLRVSALGTNEQLWLGSVDYELPLNYVGTRLGVSYTRSTYELAKEFAPLDAVGRFDVAAVRVEHSVLRSQNANVLLSAAVQHKKLQDDYRAVNIADHKRSNSVPLGVRFDMRDALGGGGVSFGALTYTAGRLQLDASQLALDAATAQKNGHFGKVNLDLARLQRVDNAWSLYGRLSAQHARKNLESSERIGLGGVNGVRAYPVGEGSGDNGELVQLEVRYTAGPWTPYAFYDAGHVKTNARPWDQPSSASRSIAGAGVGLRATLDRWALDVSVAQRTHGGASQAEPSAGARQVWFAATRRFP